MPIQKRQINMSKENNEQAKNYSYKPLRGLRTFLAISLLCWNGNLAKATEGANKDSTSTGISTCLPVSFSSPEYLPGMCPKAAEGVSKDSIIIGMSAAFSGPSGELGREYRRGANILINQVNTKGGIHGRKIIMIYRDDRYEPKLTVQNTELFIKKDNVFALFGYVGTPTTKAAIPQLIASQIPLVSPMTGAQVVRNPLQPMVFNLRASYYDELENSVDYLTSFGRKDIAIVYQDDSFGEDGLSGAKKALKRRNLEPIITAKVQRNSRETNVAASIVAEAMPEAVLIISAYGTVSSFISNLRDKGSDAQVINVSFVGSNSLLKALPEKHRHDIGISQVVPFPWDARVPIVKEYQSLMRRNESNHAFGFTSLEGFMAAKLLINALDRSGPKLSRKSFINSLKRTSNLDLGGYQVKISPGNHNASDFVQLTFSIGHQGAFIH